MTYSAGGLIEATDYNGFVSTTANANINDIWGNGSGDKGYGQTAVGTVAAAGTVTATQWASLVNTLSSLGSQTSTAITARTAPTAGTTIAVLAAVNTDLTNVTTNRANASVVGSQFTGWTGTNSKTGGTSGAAWTITFTNAVNFGNSDAARWFFNGGGVIKLQTSKTATGDLGDPEWNDLATTLCGQIYFSGIAASHTIAGVAYTGTTKIGGTGTPTTLSTATGYYALTPGGAATIIYKQFADTAPYTANYIQTSVALDATSAILTFTTLWSANDSGPGDPDPISGGTAAVAATPGTAPCTICTYVSPTNTYLTFASWGTPTVTATTT